MKISAKDHKEWRINVDVITSAILGYLDDFEDILLEQDLISVNRHMRILSYFEILQLDYEHYFFKVQPLVQEISELLDGSKFYQSPIPFQIQDRIKKRTSFFSLKKINRFESAHIKNIVERVPDMEKEKSKHRDAVISMLVTSAEKKIEAEKMYDTAKSFFENINVETFTTAEAKSGAIKNHAKAALRSAKYYILSLIDVRKALIRYNTKYCAELISEFMKPMIVEPSKPKKLITFESGVNGDKSKPSKSGDVERLSGTKRTEIANIQKEIFAFRNGPQHS